VSGSLGEIVLLALAGVLAGAINAVAGGGSLITFPVLLALGLPALTANISNSIAQSPGYLSVAIGYRRELRGQGARVRRLAPLALAGGAAGVVALHLGSHDTFRAVVPWLVLLACALLALQPRLRRRIEEGRLSPPPTFVLDVVMVLSGAYIAYFGAAAGVLLLAVLAVLVTDTLQRLNALNRLLVLLVNLPASIALAILGPVDWVAVAVLAPTTLIGGSLGVVVARRLSDRLLRIAVIVLGLSVAGYLLVS
jgi:uncharacterized membrane protein YfcA